MTHNFNKIDDIHDEYVMMLVASEEPRFGRVFNPALKSTHQLDFEERIVMDGTTKRKAIVLMMKPYSYEEIKSRSEDFSKLTMLELRELIRRYEIKVAPTEGRPVAGSDRLGMIEALRKFTPPKLSEPPPDAKPVTIIPEAILSMSYEDLITQCAVKGISTKREAGKELKNDEKGIATLRARISKAMAEEESLQPAAV